MKNGYKTTSDLPKVEVENMVKFTESEFTDITKTTFVAGMLSGGAVTAVLIIVVDLIKQIFS